MGSRGNEAVEVRLDKIVGGGQALGTLADGRKVFAWGGLPGETVTAIVTKKKSTYLQGVVTEVLQRSPDRIAPLDEDSYLSTSPWQIMRYESEQHYKALLIEGAFKLHRVTLPQLINVHTNAQQFGYRNKVEFSFWWDKDREELDLAFFRRGTHGKIPVNSTSLAMPIINAKAQAIRDVLRARHDEAFHFKTLILRASQTQKILCQLYVKDPDYPALTESELRLAGVDGFELIYSHPNSPASIVTKRLQRWGSDTIEDMVLGVPFTYGAESFFQVNIPVYEKALEDIRDWVDTDHSTVDLYSGVGSIGLTVTTGHLTLVEINRAAIKEARRAIAALGRETTATAVAAASEAALETIQADTTVIVDPPRAGLHAAVITRILSVKPRRIIYLSCNPVTQARDIALLLGSYSIKANAGYNFFPRTPHIEHLIILDRK